MLALVPSVVLLALTACGGDPATAPTEASLPTTGDEGNGAGAERPATGPASITFVNATDEAITDIFLSPASEPAWGPDQLGEDVLAPGQSITLGDATPGVWDVRVVNASGKHKEWREQTFDAGEAYTIDVGGDGWVE